MERVLVLRPEPGVSATIERARKLGLNPIAMPLFEVEWLDWEAPNPTGFDGLLLTSANALRYGGEQLRKLRGLRAYAVGEATAEAARQAGFTVEATGDSGVDRLLGSIEPGLKLLHLCGEYRRAPSERQHVNAIAVYRSKEIAQADVSVNEDDIVLVHSPRAGRRFAELVRHRTAITIAAISPDAAQAVGDGWRSVEVAAEPSDEALLALAARLCNNSPPE